MKNLISVIIPVYNSEKTLDKCINSILNQTYNNYEIILVNNSSTDSSKEIINKFIKNYKSIKYFNINEQSVGKARNKGLSVANGEFICFIDSDDIVHKNYLKTLIDNINKHDMSICAFTNNIKKMTDSNKSITHLNQSQALEHILNNRKIQGYVWNKLFKSNIIKNNNLQFNETLKIGEDIDFVFEYLKYCKNIIYVNKKLYYYNKNTNNTVTNIENYKFCLASWENMFKKYRTLKKYKSMDLINYYYLKKCYEMSYYNLNINTNNKLYFSNKFNLTFKLRLFLYKNFTSIIILAKKVRDRT